MGTLIRENAFNQTGDVNYNEKGLKDEVGFVEVPDKFVDTFLLRILVPDYNTKKGRNIFFWYPEQKIIDLLDAYGLKRCILKAIHFKKVQQEQVL